MDLDLFKGSKHIDGANIRFSQKSGGMCTTPPVEPVIAAFGPPSAFNSIYAGAGNTHMVASM
jgi:hypothetical protein